MSDIDDDIFFALGEGRKQREEEQAIDLELQKLWRDVYVAAVRTERIAPQAVANEAVKQYKQEWDI